MSVDSIAADADEQSVKEMVRDLAARVTEVEAENEALRERVDELESRPQLQWDSTDLGDLKLQHPDGFALPIGRTITSKISENNLQNNDDFAQLRDDVEALKRGEVSGADLVGSAEPKIPIEADVAKAGNEALQDDLSANEQRAVEIFRQFGGRSESWSGTLKLNSGQVKNILEEECGTEPNSNTVKRAMKMLAKKTSDAADGGRDAYDKHNNLLWLAKGEKRLQLRADKSEWLDYMQDVEERYQAP